MIIVRRAGRPRHGLAWRLESAATDAFTLDNLTNLFFAESCQNAFPKTG